jgi:hypothetical protein
MVHRTALVGASLALALVTAGGCQRANEVITGRDLVCGENVPQDICSRLADHQAPRAEQRNPTLGRVIGVTVTREDCRPINNHLRDPQGKAIRAKICWGVFAEWPAGTDFHGVYPEGREGHYYQREDGAVVDTGGSLVAD